MAHVNLNKKNPLIHRIVGDLEGNALDCVVFEPMWAIFGGLITFYQPLYMKSLGVNEVQMGMLNSILAICAVAASFTAGPVTDRMGRKRTSLIFDCVAWTVPMAVWAVFQNFWYFFIAALFNSFSKVPYTSWTCLAVEDTPEDKRVLFFSLIMIIDLASVIFTAIAGGIINVFGITNSMRGIYAVGCISMTAMFLIRNHWVEETSIGRELMHNGFNKLSGSLSVFYCSISSGCFEIKGLYDIPLPRTFCCY